MKKFYTIFYLIVVGLAAMAQPDYPVAAPLAGNMSKLEYFVDSDPGTGNGIPVTLTATQNINSFSFNADLTGIPNGFHRIYLRSMDAYGKWSHTYNAYFDNVIVPAYAIAPSPVVNFEEVEYFVDTDPGFGNGNKIVITPGSDLANQNILVNVTGLSTGVHRLYIRSKNADGKWSLTHFGLFDNSFATPYPVAPATAPLIGEMEYYIDTDPGFGNATPVLFTAGTDISNLNIDIPINSLANGTHTLYMRSRQNPWSFSAYAEFLVGSVLPVTWLYVKGLIQEETAVISWATASEENTREFIVEHSVNGNDFEMAGLQSAAGNSSSSKTYSFHHNAPVQGFNYYRIKQIDMDGKFLYSKIITLFKANKQKTTVIGPNPVKDVLHLIEPTDVAIKKMEIYDMNGRLLISKTIESEGKVFSVSTSSLRMGNYILKIMYKNSTKTFKLIKE